MPIAPTPILLQCPKCKREELYRPHMISPLRMDWNRFPRCPECHVRMKRHPTKIILS